MTAAANGAASHLQSIFGSRSPPRPSVTDSGRVLVPR